MTAIEFVEIARLDAPALSPDGRTLAFLRSSTDWETNKVVDRLHLMDAETGEMTPAFPAAEEDETHSRAVWSPEAALRAPDKKGVDEEPAVPDGSPTEPSQTHRETQ